MATILEPGQNLLHYRLVEQIGEGGMGVVWKAVDTALGREVAIKVLPEAFAADPERLARFEREARLLASLNHPNIAAVFGLHPSTSSGQVAFIAMELVRGEDLAARLRRGPLPLEEGLRLCAQVAEALETAHERGVIHRDLKPANIVLGGDRSLDLTPKAKVLDFGLAKALADSSAGSDPGHSPTVTSLGSVAGVVLGTAAYMSPEQARGNPVDVRTDVFAFGCVLYEVLTGRRAFGGNTVSDSLAAVLAREPDWSALPPETPERVRVLLRRFLEKDITRRPRDIGLARIEIADALEGKQSEPPRAAEVPQAAAKTTKSRMAGWLLVAAVAAVGLVAGWFARPVPSPALPQSIRSGVDLPAGLRGIDAMELTADGQRLLVAGQLDKTTSIFVRRLSDDDFRLIPGTEGTAYHFLSPDGAWVGFFADGKLKKAPVDGGSAVVICDAPDGRGAVWASDGTIYFTPFYTSGLHSVPFSGGDAVEMTRPDPQKRELSHRFPATLPDARALLFTIELPGSFDNAQIGLLTLDDLRYRVLIEDGSYARYTSSGHIVFVRDQTLYAAPFDARTLALTGTPTPVLDHVVDDVTSGTAAFTFTKDGLLAYAPSTVVDNRRIVRVGPDGSRQPFVEQSGAFRDLSVAPDGKRLTVTLRHDIWILERERGALTRLTFDPGADWFGQWTPDGQRVVFTSSRDGAFNLYWRRADGGGDDERLTTSDEDQMPGSWSPDGGTLAFYAVNPQTGRDLWLLHIEGTPRVEPFLVTGYNESNPVFSPDGRWIAYTADESGSRQIHVRPYPGPGGRWQVSTNGGEFAAWSRDGRDLYYLAGDGLWSAPVLAGADFRVGTPRHVTDAVNLRDARTFFGFVPAPDGDGFLFIEEGSHGAPIRLITNWFGDLTGRGAAER